MKKLNLRITSLLLALLLVLAAGGCSLFSSDDGDEESGPEEELVDDTPTEYPVELAGARLQARPGKVVSLAPSITEKIYDLGLQDRLVGVSDYCDYPSDIRGLTRCGYTLVPDLDAIYDLAPHLLITDSQLAEKDLIALQQRNIEVAVLPRAESVDQLCGVYESLAMLLEGAITGYDMGERFTQRFLTRLDSLYDAVLPYVEDGGRLALYLRLLDFTVATGDTLEHELMDTIGLRNVAGEYTDWQYPAEAAQSESGRAGFTAVELIFMDNKGEDEETDEGVTIRMLERSDFYKGLPAVLQDWYLYIDSSAFERQSLRMLDQLQEMARYAYPEANIDPANIIPIEHEPEDEEEPEGEDEEDTAASAEASVPQEESSAAASSSAEASTSGESSYIEPDSSPQSEASQAESSQEASYVEPSSTPESEPEPSSEADSSSEPEESGRQQNEEDRITLF